MWDWHFDFLVVANNDALVLLALAVALLTLRKDNSLHSLAFSTARRSCCLMHFLALTPPGPSELQSFAQSVSLSGWQYANQLSLLSIIQLTCLTQQLWVAASRKLQKLKQNPQTLCCAARNVARKMWQVTKSAKIAAIVVEILVFFGITCLLSSWTDVRQVRKRNEIQQTVYLAEYLLPACAKMPTRVIVRISLQQLQMTNALKATKLAFSADHFGKNK